MKLAKKNPKKKAVRKTAVQESAEDRLLQRIAEKETQIVDGSLQVALAIAAMTQMVRVDASTVPFSVDPPDLFELRFNDNKVGFDDDDMPIFKANLAAMLPKIRREILEEVEDNANVPIALVVDFVTLSLVTG